MIRVHRLVFPQLCFPGSTYLMFVVLSFLNMFSQLEGTTVI